MAASRIRGTARQLSYAVVALLSAVIVLVSGSCGANQVELAGAVPSGGHVVLTAAWLAEQPGLDLGAVQFRLLDANCAPVVQWRGITITPGGPDALDFTISIARGAPNDIYLYAIYSGEHLAYHDAVLDSSRGAEYICLAASRCIKDVVAVGVARTGKFRRLALKPGALLTLQFTTGPEQPLRHMSMVNQDPQCAADLSVTQVAGGAQLEWDERNIGDYDNNSQVGISDVTPVGVHFGKLLVDSPEYEELLLVDGDANGIINVADVTAIGRNFGSYLQGFTVYHATTDPPQPADFAPIAQPTVLRSTVWDSATPAERKRRLHYTYTAPAPAGANAYYVTPWSGDGGNSSEGAASNIVELNTSGGGVWPQQRFDAARTGCNPQINLAAPQQVLWEQPLAAALPDQRCATPVISNDDWTGIFDAAGEFLRYSLATGTLLATHPAPAAPAALTDGVHPVLEGDRLVVGVTTGIAVYDLTGTDAPQLYTGAGPVTTAPVVDGGWAYTVDQAGEIRASAIDGTVGGWVYSASPAQQFNISPCSDGSYLYAVDDSGKLYKLALADGSLAASGTLPAAPAGNALALDAGHGRLYIGTAEDRLVEVDAATLAINRRFTLDDSEHVNAAPCLLLDADPPLAVVSIRIQSMIESASDVLAINLTDWSLQWKFTTEVMEVPRYLTASANRICVDCYNAILLLDTAGQQRQRLMTDALSAGEIAMDQSHLVRLGTSKLECYQQPATNLPPEWNNKIGIQKLRRTLDAMTAEWEWATDPEGAPVWYAIFYAAGQPPSLTPPYTGTTVIEVRPDQSYLSNHSYSITGLDPAVDYYAAVKACDAPWDENPAIDPNTVYLQTSPGWQREELVLGADLPTGKVNMMRGIVVPSGKIHLVYMDTDTGYLTHVFGDTGDWQSDGAGLLPMDPVTSFDPAWDDTNAQFTIAYSDLGGVGLIRNTGFDAWSIQYWDDALPVLNPQVAVGFTPGLALGYTRYYTGTPPDLTTHYYLRREMADVLQPFEVLDDTNYCGRDIDMLDGYASSLDRPSFVMQRGTEQVPNRLTPEKGILVRAETGIFNSVTVTTIDAGANAPDSDCGKRVRTCEGVNQNYAAYLDLNASSSEPTGQLKLAQFGGEDPGIKLLDTFPLDFQSTQYMQNTYGELGCVIDPIDSQPRVALLFRLEMPASGEGLHNAEVRYYMEGWHDGVYGWFAQRLTLPEGVFMRDREPCVMLVTPDAITHIFFASYSNELDKKADKIVHLYSVF